MPVILQHDLANLGKTGEVVKVRPGYARNYLLPKQLAAAATSKNMSRIEHEQRAAAAKAAKAKVAAEELAKKVGETAISLTRKAGEEGKLFGAVTAKEIEAALAEKGVAVDRRKIQLAEPIKAVGKYEIAVKLGFEVTATIKLDVVAR
ncbi:MAG: 50S ribosomal protein L9 [Myxococcales bacterium]|nr:50S ribosomal protein L9 [Myxococcales bacterium]MBL8719183.1 50S ribosomal protein L9 [Myxococcales bacterium]